MKKLFVLNKNAGDKSPEKYKEKILSTYKKYNREKEVEVLISSSIEETKEKLKYFSNYKEEKVVIAAGGDGTIGAMASLISNTDIALGLIPYGTANDFSKILDYENFSIEDTFDINIKPIDLMEINGKKAINVMSLGFDTEVLKNSYDYLKKYPKLKKKAFYFGVLKSLFNISAENLRIELFDGRVFEGKFLISAVCNGGYYGSGYNPAPNAILDDGLLDLILIKEMNLFEMVPYISAYKKGKHLNHKKAEEIKTKGGKITSENEFLYNIDGEIMKTSEIKFKVLENDLRWAYFRRGKGLQKEK